MTDGAPREHFDVLIVGAGISGIGAAYHLTKQCPGATFLVLDAKESFGGTWITHRYPGIRSDSDLYTFGYRFKPWVGAPIATGAEILAYLGEVIAENGLDAHIRYRHRIVVGALVQRGQCLDAGGDPQDSGQTILFTANFLWMCQGYYSHAKAMRPNGRAWRRSPAGSSIPRPGRKNLDYAGKTVVVIGSGATAATLIPAIADQCAEVTMLQRSPTYYITGRNASVLADTLRELDVDEEWIHEITRRKILYDQATFTRRCFSEPEIVKQELLSACAPSSAPTTTSPPTSRRSTCPGASASPSFRTAISSRRCARIEPASSPTRSSGSAGGHPDEVRQATRSRHPRHGDRVQSQCARRHRL